MVCFVLVEVILSRLHALFRSSFTEDLFTAELRLLLCLWHSLFALIICGSESFLNNGYVSVRHIDMFSWSVECIPISYVPCVCLNVCVYMLACVRVRACVCLCVYVSVCACVCACVYMRVAL
eukprot:Opistho-2@78642